MDYQSNASITEDDILDNFCYMVIEEFLVRKDMKDTLQTFRQEWDRPNEDTVLYSWYDVALKLRLPDLIAQAKREGTVLENLVHALIRESSIKNRRPTELTISGLATMPKTTSLPSLAEPSPIVPFNKPTSANSSPMKRSNQSQSKSNDNQDSKPKKEGKSHAKRSLDTFSNLSSNLNNNRAKLSNESWIPDEIRFKSLHRELMTVKEILVDTKTLEVSLAREMKRLNISELDRAKTEERLVATRKIPCGCCTQEFLYVNLPMKVSRKAILDIRVKWSGSLSSATVFRGTSARELADSLAQINKSKKNSKSGGSDILSDSDAMTSSVPRCYDKVGVCIFCAQFFQEPEEYRPSYQAIVYQEKKSAYFENKRREREYWDPLKMLEKDREALEAAEEDQAKAET